MAHVKMLGKWCHFRRRCQLNLKTLQEILSDIENGRVTFEIG